MRNLSSYRGGSRTPWILPALLLGAMLASPAARSQNRLPPGTQDPDAAQLSGQDVPAKAGSIPPELGEVESKIEQKDFTGARLLVQKYLAQHAGDARALFDLGYIEDADGHEDAAAAAYRQAIASNPKQFESRLALGLLLAHQAKWDEAREQLAAATQLQPASENPAAKAQAFRALAEVERTRDPEAAKDALLAALKLSPEVPADLLLTAQIAEADDDPETAEAAYRRLLGGNAGASGPTASAATAGLVQLLLKRGKYDEAEPLLKSALGRDPDDSALNAQLATTLIHEGKKEEALPVLEKLSRLEPNDPAVNQMLADAYTEAGHPEKAGSIYAAMAQAHPDDPQVLAGQGQNFLLEKRYPEAEEAFERAVKLKPDDADSWSGLAFAATQTKQYSVALQALSMRAKYRPEIPSTYFLRAIAYDNLHQTKAAEQYYREFLAAAGGKYPDEEWQAKHRLIALDRSR